MCLSLETGPTDLDFGTPQALVLRLSPDLPLTARTPKHTLVHLLPQLLSLLFLLLPALIEHPRLCPQLL